jgi:hypothetical protein
MAARKRAPAEVDSIADTRLREIVLRTGFTGHCLFQVAGIGKLYGA